LSNSCVKVVGRTQIDIRPVTPSAPLTSGRSRDNNSPVFWCSLYSHAPSTWLRTN